MNLPIAFFDLETRSELNIRTCGLRRYRNDPTTEVLCNGVIFPDGRKGVWAPEHCRLGLETDDWVFEAWNTHVRSGGLVAAHNAQFDRAILQDCQAHGLAAPSIEQTLCAQTLCENYGLPGKLAQACIVAKVDKLKDPAGARLIRKFSHATIDWPEETEVNREDLKLFWRYCLADVEAMQALWAACRPWAAEEWRDYHALERMNELGMAVDVEFAKAASALSKFEMAELNAELVRITGVAGITLKHSAKKRDWLDELCRGTDFEECLLATTVRKRKKVIAKSGNKQVQANLREKLDTNDDGGLPEGGRERLRAFLEVLEEGNSVASAKFDAISRLQHGGRISHQYRCSPTITGRHAGRGVGLDNIYRDGLEPGGIVATQDNPAADAIDCIVGAGPYHRIPMRQKVTGLKAFYGLPLSRVLARLVRPTIIAPEDRHLVWGDWNAVEPRCLAWLAESERGLGPWVRGEDKYCQAAVATLGLKIGWEELKARAKAGVPEAVEQRTLGKVQVLALGYCGGVGALLGQARGMGVQITEAFAQQLVRRFRDSEPWMTHYWRRLEEACWNAAQSSAGRRFSAGRIAYQRVGQDLWCILPDGRPIVYPKVRVREKYIEKWDKVVEVIEYRKAWGGTSLRADIWRGILIENADQGTCASLLRWLIRRLQEEGFGVAAIRHDEVMLETKAGEDPASVRERLREIMEEGPSWAEGFPLAAETDFGVAYGK